MNPISLAAVRRIHVVGVGGPGMSALARVLSEMGHDVSGSDIRESATTKELRLAGVDVRIGHVAESVAGVDIVTYPTGLPDTNVELVAARGAGAAVVHRSELLAEICASTRAVAVAGTHGKTTTSALLVHVLRRVGLPASWLIGAQPRGVLPASHWDPDPNGDLFVVEADESDGTHDVLDPWGAVVTNIDKDHLDHFGTLDGIVDSFAGFMRRLSGPIVVCGDDPQLGRALVEASLSADPRVVSYGTGESNDVRIADVVADPGGTEFTLISGDERVPVATALHGIHNASNIAGAVAMASALGVSIRSAAEAVADFPGVERRLELKGIVGGAEIFDDYAHVPAEIASTLAALRARRPGTRVIAVFQPNRYHRIASMHADYAGCFDGADLAIITDIYASGTSPIPGVTGRLVADAVAGSHAGVVWAPTRQDVVAAVRRSLSEGVVCVAMGCGDISTLYDDLTSGVAHTAADAGGDTVGGTT